MHLWRARNAGRVLLSDGQPGLRPLLHAIARLAGPDYIWTLYRQWLNREPTYDEMLKLERRLAGGYDKAEINGLLLLGDEAEALYTQPHRHKPADTIAAYLHELYGLPAVSFFHVIYERFAGRLPTVDELEEHLSAHASGVWRSHILSNLLMSGECDWMNLDHPTPPEQVGRSEPLPLPLAPRADRKRVGIFLGYSERVRLEGEGIFAFAYQLAHGLLAYDDNTIVHIAGIVSNGPELRSAFASSQEAYGERLVIDTWNSMEGLNRHAPVDVWIVPYAGMELAAYLERPYIVCLFDLVHHHFKKWYFDHAPEWCAQIDKVVERTTTGASAVVFASRFIRNHDGLQRLGLPMAKTRVIPLAAAITAQPAHSFIPESEFRSLYRLDNDYIAFPSVIRFHKNHDRLIEAFLSYKQSEAGREGGLLLVLTDQLENRPLRNEIERLLRECPSAEAAGSVRFLGRIPAEHVPSLYRYAKGTIVPTLFEGSCPFPILESLSVGTPAAMSRLEVVREVIDDVGSFPSFDPYETAEIESAIAELAVMERDVRGQCRAVGHALDRSWVQVAHDFIALIYAGPEEDRDEETSDLLDLQSSDAAD